MVNVEHLDDIENVDCRWYIEGVGAVFQRLRESTEDILSRIARSF